MPTTPHSAAGWRIDPPVSEPSASGANPAATAAADPPDEPPGTLDVSWGLRWGRTPSSRSSCPWRTRRGWSCPRRRPRRRPASRPRWRRRAGASPRGCATSRSSAPRGAHVVLERHGHAGQRAGVLARGDARSSARAAWRAWSAVTRLKAWISPSRAAMAVRCSSTTSTAAGAGPDRGGDAGRPVGVGTSRSRRLPQHRRDAELAVLDSGGGRQDGIAVEAGAGLVAGRSTFCSGYGCEVGGTSPTSSASTSRAWSSTLASWSVNVPSSSSVSSSRASRPRARRRRG